MKTGPRCARVKALAKINLSLKVLHKRPDGFHELRTIYQTISLADSIDLEFTPSRRTSITLLGENKIPDNLVTRAAKAAMDRMQATGRVSLRLTKVIPVGAGLGGGSSDAAAVLLALPVLAGKPIPLPDLVQVASELGSDVPFFLLGGTAVGLGRGTELYPLPDAIRLAEGLLIAPTVEVSTREAYVALGRELTTKAPENIINSFQSFAWCGGLGVPAKHWLAFGENDFEEVVFRQHPRLKSFKRKLKTLGADLAMMTGSGSALFGFFRSRAEVERAVSSFRKERVFRVALVSRTQYRAMWRRSLSAHSDKRVWPPQSRSARWDLTG
jgi:4-diphosphocytidyl-2-C-methyl-D-erythritol kinase